MREHEVREGDIVRIEYDTKFAKEHIDEGKALILWKGINRQPLVVKLDHLKNGEYNPGWTCYEYIAEVVGHMSITDMLKSQCGLGTLDSPTTNGVAVDSISRQAVDELSKNLVHVTRDKADFLCNFWEGLQKLPPVTPQPCEDAVSRQAVLDLATTIKTDDYSGNEIMEVVEVEDIKALPPVTPKEKTGRWEVYEVVDFGEWKGTEKYKCSECGEEVGVFKSNFCPNCGARMVSE